VPFTSDRDYHESNPNTASGNAGAFFFFRSIVRTIHDGLTRSPGQPLSNTPSTGREAQPQMEPESSTAGPVMFTGGHRANEAQP
jgi:hypothetical protein